MNDENDGELAVEEHPEEIQEQDGPPTYGPNNCYLPDQLQNAIRIAIETQVGARELYDRRRQVMRVARNKYYRRGFQHIYENRQTGMYVQAVAGEAVAAGGGMIECPQYVGDYNIVRPTELVIESVLTQNPPGIDFRPDTQVTEDLEAAKTAEVYREFFDRSNDVKGLQLKIVQSMCESGLTIVTVSTEANEQLWGVGEDGEPKQNETARVWGALEARVLPLTANCLDEVDAVVLYDDPTVNRAKMEYPEIAKKIKSLTSGLGEDAYARIARLGILQGTRKYAQVGDALTHLSVRANAYLRPCCFVDDKFDDAYELQGKTDNYEADEPDDNKNDDGTPFSVRDKLDQLFPQGVHAVFIGKTYAEAWAESIDDGVVIGFPYEGDGMAREAIMDDAIVIQDFFNDILNSLREAQDYGWPRTFIHAEDAEFDAIQDQKSEPYAFSMKKARSGQPLEADFFREPDLVLPESLSELMEYLAGPFMQFVLGTPPALFGGQMADQKLMDVNEPIPTPKGFVPNGDLRDGDEVFGQDGKTYNIVKAHPAQRIAGYNVTFDDGTSVRVHAGHLWETSTRKQRWNSAKGGKKSSVLTTEEIAETLFVGREDSKMGVCVNHTVDLAEAVELPDVRLPIDPYCLGAWLGDGRATGGSHYTATDADGAEIMRYFEAAGYKTNRTKQPNDWTIWGITKDLKKMGLVNNKHIPDVYLWASPAQRLDLLQGLMDTDGNCSQNGRARFANTSIDLATGVYHIAASLGLKPFIKTSPVYLKGKRCADCTYVEWASTLPVFRIKRKLAGIKKAYRSVTKWRYITSVSPCGDMEMRCLTTDNPRGLYLFGKNFNVTHNTASGYAQAKNQAMGVKGIPWMSLQTIMARMYYLAALKASKNPDHAEQILVPVKGQTQVLKLERLTKGKFGAFPDEDSSFPETTSAKRDLLSQLLTIATTNPTIGAQLLGDTYNWEIICQIFGFKELQLMEAESAKKQMREIEELLQGQPLPPTPDEVQAFAQQQELLQTQHAAAALMAQQQGQPPPPAPDPPKMISFGEQPGPDGQPVPVQYPEALLKPSIDVDDLDFHQWEGPAGQDWLSTEAAWREINVGRPGPDGEPVPNTLGVENVRLHVKLHLERMAIMAQAQQAAPTPIMRHAPPPQQKQPPPAPAAAPTM